MIVMARTMKNSKRRGSKRSDSKRSSKRNKWRNKTVKKIKQVGGVPEDDLQKMSNIYTNLVSYGITEDPDVIELLKLFPLDANVEIFINVPLV